MAAQRSKHVLILTGRNNTANDIAETVFRLGAHLLGSEEAVYVQRLVMRHFPARRSPASIEMLNDRLKASDMKSHLVCWQHKAESHLPLFCFLATPNRRHNARPLARTVDARISSRRRRC